MQEREASTENLIHRTVFDISLLIALGLQVGPTALLGVVFRGLGLDSTCRSTVLCPSFRTCGKHLVGFCNIYGVSWKGRGVRRQTVERGLGVLLALLHLPSAWGCSHYRGALKLALVFRLEPARALRRASATPSRATPPMVRRTSEIRASSTTAVSLLKISQVCSK